MGKFFERIWYGLACAATFIFDKGYRDLVIKKYWEWRAKSTCVILLVTVLFLHVMKTDFMTSRWETFKGCVGEQWDTGRETKFGFAFNSCVIDSGKRGESGEIVWQKVKRDFNVGDGQ